jgi:2-oxoisovalerate dehydrogenase E1 component
MRTISFSQATLEALDEEMARDERIFVVGEGIGPRGGNFNTTLGLFEKYGEERLRDTPISERGFSTLCTGAAVTGSRPVVDFMFSDFMVDALGDLINQTGKLQWMSSGRLKMPIVLRSCFGLGSSAAAHHSGYYHTIFMHLPGFRVVMPSNPYDAKGLLKTAIRSDDPVVFLEHRNILGTKGDVPEGEYLIPFGQAAVVRPGTDLTIVGLSITVLKALEASKILEQEGISTEVIDPRTVAPLDIETILASVKKTGRLLIVDEDYPVCNLGAEVAAQVADLGFDDLDAPIRRLSGKAVPAPYAQVLEAGLVPTSVTIAQAARDLIAE